MTYTVNYTKQIRMASRNVCTWNKPYFENTFEVDEAGKDLLIHMQEDLMGFHKTILDDGRIRLYKQTACNECEILIITENK